MGNDFGRHNPTVTKFLLQDQKRGKNFVTVVHVFEPRRLRGTHVTRCSRTYISTHTFLHHANMSTAVQTPPTRPPPSEMRIKKLEELKRAQQENKTYTSTDMKLDEDTESPVTQCKTPLSMPMSYTDVIPTVTIDVKEGRGGNIVSTPLFHHDGMGPVNMEVTLGPCRIRKSAFANPCFGKNGDLGTSKFATDPSKAKWSVMVDTPDVIEFVEKTCENILRAIYNSTQRDDKWDAVVGEKSVSEFVNGVTYPCVKTDSFSGDKYITLGRKLKTWRDMQYIRFWDDGEPPKNIRGTNIQQGAQIKCGCTFRAYAFSGKYGIALDLGEDVVLLPESPSKRKRDEDDTTDPKRQHV